MKPVLALACALLVLSGCSMFGGERSACEVFSPAPVNVPSNQNDQRVQTNATGDPTGGRNNLQDCGSQ
ncbi:MULTISPECIES: hypothetical protein [Pseudomonas]|uniref:Lipoprotein n=1 Tax=Pseudomonas quercus TaxID=2722792 RepID=A0ABX0YKE8_9PSED|nr:MULTISPECIES: hypothetical protein [Pseudomonas]MBF7143699.1 hypothetical protein [Pseudomonas sp. LY10J]NJP02423.1 hypothetical protein [Pseudomonas quercus]